MSERFHFRIPIGDWSGDGHSQCEWYDATAAIPLDEVRDAYFAAKKKKHLEGISPEDFCSEYEDSEVPEDVREQAKAAGYEMPEDFHVEEMANYVVWFINQGNPKADVRLEETPETLTFYGYDDKNRHIGFIGYGFLGN